MSTEIQKAEQALAAAKRNEQLSKDNKKIALNKYCIGKCFKSVSNHAYTVSINYHKVVDFVRYKDGKIMYSESADHLVSETVQITYSTPGYIIQHGDLMYVGAYNKANIPIKKHYDKDVIIEPASTNNFSYFRPEQKNEAGDIYESRNWWTQCSLEEFNDVREKTLDISAKMKDTFKRYASKEHMLYGPVQLEVVDKKLLEDLIKKIDNKEIKLEDYIHIAKKASNFVPFNSSNQLTELTQYYLTNNKTGLNLSIAGGDDGTDYEPYTTKYVLEHVDIEWEKVLYTIRTKLDSVLKTADDLRKIKDVYNTNKWLVHYSGQYDVHFNSCTLEHMVLEQVNQVIKKHLKI